MRRLPILFALLFAVPAAAQVTETITVARVLLDVRVTDFDGDPILNLTKSDFTVSLGGKPAAVESVTWVPETAAARVIAGMDDEPAPAQAGVDGELAPQGRLFVVFIQTDFGRSSVRAQGQMYFLKHAQQIIEEMEPEDRVAVFSFDSHLKFRLDFTDDKNRVAAEIADAIAISEPPTPPIVPNPSLSRRLDREEMKKATSSEEALIIVGNALRPIPGPKTLLLLGWGLGEYVGGQVIMTKKYSIARRVLEAARVTVFALDTSYTAYHSLEAGLKKAANDTGGYYSRTSDFPGIAVDRLRKTLAGHYELEVRRPEVLAPGAHAVDVRVKKRGVRVLAPANYTDKG